MLSLSALEDKLFASGRYSVHLTVSVDSPVSVELTNLQGRNWVQDFSYGSHIDQPVGSAELLLRREDGKLSLATLMGASRLNKGPIGQANVILKPGRFVSITASISPPGAGPTAWVGVFSGYIDSVDWESDPVRVSLRDEACLAQDTFIERERVYGIHRRGAKVWAAGTSFISGEHIIPSTPNGYIYVCDVSGITGATEPTWPTTVGTVTDNTITWAWHAAESAGIPLEQTIADILLDNSVSLNLYTPSSPNWSLKRYIQQRQSVLDAINTLALQIGWTLRWSPTAGGGRRLVLSQPDRANATPARTFGPSLYVDIRRMNQSREAVRNVVRVIYSDSSAVLPDGSWTRKAVEVSDATSITDYGRRFCEIAEASTSNIDTSTEATALANAVLSDLKDPLTFVEVELPYFYAAELGDLYRFSPNGVHHDGNLDLAVFETRHSLQAGDDGVLRHRTVLGCRGKAAGLHRRWHSRLAALGRAPARRDVAPNAPTGITVTNYAGMSVVKCNQPIRWDTLELYVSASNNFTPSSSNLEAKARATQFSVRRAAGTYYGRIITRDAAGGASAPSAQFTLVPT